MGRGNINGSVTVVSGFIWIQGEQSLVNPAETDSIGTLTAGGSHTLSSGSGF